MHLLSGKGFLLCFFTFATLFPPPTQGIKIQQCATCSSFGIGRKPRHEMAPGLKEAFQKNCSEYKIGSFDPQFAYDCSKLTDVNFGPGFEESSAEYAGVTDFVCGRGTSYSDKTLRMTTRQCIPRAVAVQEIGASRRCKERTKNGILFKICWCDDEDMCEPPLENAGFFESQSSSLWLGGILLGLGTIYWILDSNHTKRNKCFCIT